jgi:hypothetical protein
LAYGVVLRSPLSPLTSWKVNVLFACELLHERTNMRN